MNVKVFLVGAGPGDPDLLTVKALRLIEQSEVVVYDRLVSPGILALIPTGTKRIYAGKACGAHHLDQDAINDLLVSLARSGRNVVRLKGGDPFVFGRGSEEAQYLHQHGISFEVVPGITAAIACTTYAGIPLTHRGLANGVRIVTGHGSNNDDLDLDWQGMANKDTTLVIYMGLGNIEKVTHGLKNAGRSGETPVAIIERGTTAQQRCLITHLNGMSQCALDNAVESPALIVIGQVVELASELDWFITGDNLVQYEQDQDQQQRAYKA
ncbi:MAG: uroporphyrinogen-III C-methyltransferase [Gammaproteobacteria bacterium]|nr:uroporphyrinogen-III C-methyltransferase [Gammaproteobacteria bacterium]